MDAATMENCRRECEAINGLLRERVGAERWVTGEQLVAGRWDARWKAEMATRNQYD